MTKMATSNSTHMYMNECYLKIRLEELYYTPERNYLTTICIYVYAFFKLNFKFHSKD